MNTNLLRTGLKILAVLIVTAIMLPPVIWAENITGLVVDKNGRPIIGVNVSTNLEGIGTITDENGRFSIIGREGIDRLTFSSVGFKPKQFKTLDLPENIVLDNMYYRGTDIVVHASRAEPGVTPIAFDNYSNDEIKRDYTVSEFPLLLNVTPNVYVFSDNGGMLGYTYLRLRGFDDRRIVTYINGVPLNDPEDQVTYFIDLPDFSANVSDIQVQRGVGNSLYGDASFGGSINVVTNNLAAPRSAVFTAGAGSFTSDGESIGKTYKQSFQFNSGLVDGRWVYGGRFSKQKSDGYREQSWYDGWSYYFALSRIDSRTTTEINMFGGPMKVHAAWYGAERSSIESDRRANVGIPGYEELSYENAIDNFNQPHYQLHNTYFINDKMTLTNTLYYIRGKGYYEQYKPYQTLADYNIPESMTDGAIEGDVVRQKWVEKNQTGWNPRLDIEHAKGRHTIGGSFYYFNSDHYGKVVWAQHIVDTLNPQQRYYNHKGKKYVGSLYAQEYYQLNDKLSALFTGQLRYQKYDFAQIKMGPYRGHKFDIDWIFFSPRLGFTYNLDEQTMFFANVSLSHRTPSDAAVYDADDPYPGTLPLLDIKDSAMTTYGYYRYNFGDPIISSERLIDFELGGEYRTVTYAVSANLFWMDFKDMIVGEGGVTDGIEHSLNVDKVVHAGIELTGAYNPVKPIKISGNFSYNFNRIKDFIYEINYDFDTIDASSNPNEIAEMVAIDLNGKKTPRFPEYLGNLIIDFKQDNFRLTWRNKFIGKQYADLMNFEELAIKPVYTASLSASYTIGNIFDLGKLSVTGRIDNLFDKKYEAAVAYAEDYAYREQNQSAVIEGWPTYFVAPERSFYGQLHLDLF